MRRSKSIIYILLLFIAFALGGLIFSSPKNQNSSNPTAKSQTSGITSTTSSEVSKSPTTAPTLSVGQTQQSSTGITAKRIIDGDTLELSTGQKVRLIGINTPEMGQPYSQEARTKLSDLTLNKQLRLEKDVSETDKYGRLLRFIYIGDLFVNEEMIKQGFAKVYTYPPDVKFAEQFKQAETYARQKQLGLWSAIQNTQECLIKGNINSSGEKIYHIPGGAYYSKTGIDESKGERWFCTETEAQAAGWRKSAR